MSLLLGKVVRSSGERMIVACSTPDCNQKYEVAARTLRDMRVKGRLPVCPYCRDGIPIAATEADRCFWIDRFTIWEIVVMAEALWGTREDW